MHRARAVSTMRPRRLSFFLILVAMASSLGQACRVQAPAEAEANGGAFSADHDERDESRAGTPQTMADVLTASKPSDWRALDPQNTLYMELDTGRVIMELAPSFAPKHVANLRILVKERFFDGLFIIRSQDNYVVQWGDPAEGEEGAKSLRSAKTKLPGEYFRKAAGLPFHRLDSRDPYADEVGFVAGFPVGRDGPEGRVWLAHCYGMLGAGRDAAPDSGNAAQLYVVTGHAPRHLDRNVTLLGRVVQGIEHLTTLPRGSGALGFFETPEERVPIRTIRFAAEIPAKQRSELEALRTDTETFDRFVDARRHRREPWFLDEVGRVGLCNVPLPVRRRIPSPNSP